MGDSPIFNTIKNVAGYGVGTLAALDTIKGGGLGNYLMNRQRLMSDPGFRSSLAGSPFAAGVFGVSGDTGPAPAAPSALPATGQPVVQPADFTGPPPPGVQVAQPGQTGALPAPTALNVPGYQPGTPRAWMPNLPPYDPEQALKQQGLATATIGLSDPDPGRRAQSKMAAGIPLNDDEIAAAVKRGAYIQSQAGPGTVVKLDIPGMTTNIGSPYTSIGNEEYPTYGAAAAAAAAKNASIPAGNPQYTVVPSGRNTFLVSPPASSAQTMPAAPPPAVRAEPPAAARAAPPPPPATPPVTPPASAAAPPPPPAGVTRLAPPPPPPQPAAAQPPAEPPPVAAAPPPPPPPPPPPAPPPPPPAPPPAPAPYAAPFVTRPPEIPPYASPAAPPTASPLTPYVPPGTPKMAPSVRVAPGSPPMGGRVGYPSPAFTEPGAAAAPSAAPAQAATPSAAAGAPTPVYPVQGFVVHHSGGSSLNALVTTLQQRGLGSQYLMDRDGTVYAFGGAGSRQMQPNDRWGGVAPGLSNHNAVGMEVVAKNDQDVTPAQVASARRFIEAYYPNTPVYGHGEVNPGHKQASEGMTIVNAVRADRGTEAPPPNAQLASAGPGATVAFPSPAFVDTGGAAPADVGYPSPAPAPVDFRGVPFRRTVPDLTPSALGLPPPPRPGVPADIGAPTGTGGPPLFPLVDARTGVPLSGVTEKGTTREQTYSVPSPAAGDVAANMQAAGITDFRTATKEQVTEYKRLVAQDEARKKVMDADITRARGATPGENAKALNVFNDYRQALNTYLADFPNPEDRAKYVGLVNQPIQNIKSLVNTDPRFELFLRDVDPFQYHAYESKSGALSDDEQHALANLLPTGHEWNAISHEERLQGFNDVINARLGMRTAQLHMSPDEITPAWWNAANQALADQAAADKAQVGGGVAGGVVGAALGAPPASPPPGPPPTAPPVAAPPPTTPPPFTVLGHWQE